ncbi:ABC transporter substrate-binding protein [Variovorax sp. J22R115]|uniref:ABC transporter substrate-binding protein n=1 Tax=Variovorax sp. J22R115 TaxID=3053509 RepID=UPI002577F36B|nr:ABC transporter substrate-binding protein [Variovorax sp. J22R115]MDM0053907.1 ABC transporter substrate-binding protein [Variovorax sp. J22R115]
MRTQRRCLVLAGCATLLALPSAALSKKHHRLGVLSIDDNPVDPIWIEFLLEMARLGLTEGYDFTVVPSFVGRDGKTAEDAAQELVAHKVDAIYVSGGTGVVKAAMKATSTIPIVMLTSADPVRDGLVASLRRPDGNVTGNAVLAPELLAKRLQFLVEITRRPRKVAFLTTASSPIATRPEMRAALDAKAKSMDTSAQVFPIASIDELDSVIQEISRSGLPLMADSTALFYINVKRLGELVVQNRVPAIGDGRRYAEAGFLVAYGLDYHDLARRCARFIAKIFQGADPGKLPVELANKFDLVLNLRTATRLGIGVPKNFISGATAIIR